jgi:hypothetical protein
MNTEAKRAAALELLASTGIWRIHYAPPIARLLWRLGINVPPPHFASFRSNVLPAGVYFGAASGLLMWYFDACSAPIRWYLAAAAGLLFGLWMAAYYAYGARKYAIPRWSNFQGGLARPRNS